MLLHRTHNDHFISAIKLTKAGTLQATREQLHAIFGPPDQREDGDIYSDDAWRLFFPETGVRASLNNIGEGMVGDEIVWTIWGSDPRAHALVHQAFRENLGKWRSAVADAKKAA